MRSSPFTYMGVNLLSREKGKI